jgi:hypothetical protein
MSRGFSNSRTTLADSCITLAKSRITWRIPVLLDGFELPLEVLGGIKSINLNGIGQEAE